MLAAVGDTHLHLNPTLLTYAVGFVIPLVVGFVTKLHASSGLKAFLNFVLSAIAGGLAVALTAKGDVVLSTWLAGIGQTFVVSIASYYGLWKPTGVAQSVQTSTANVGVGSEAPYAQSSGTGSRDDILPGSKMTAPPEVAEPADAVVKAPPKRTSKSRAAAKKTK